MKSKQIPANASGLQSDKTTAEAKRNEDPISGEPGAHPVGVGVGAVLGGAATGALAGAVGGPLGAALGAVVGSVAGGYAGKAKAEAIDPTVEIAYWREQYAHAPYYDSQRPFDDYEPAYRAGVEAFNPDEPKSWDESETLAREDYEGSTNNLSWKEASVAAKDAYTRVERNVSSKPN